MKIKGFNVDVVRSNFPILVKDVEGKKLVYLDNAATSHKPQSVIDLEQEYYSNYNSNIHRGLHTLSEKSTDLYEGVREKIRSFINAKSSNEIIFCKGATEAINLVSNSYVKDKLDSKSNVVISRMEHHANIVPWYILCQEKKSELRISDISDKGELELESLYSLIDENTKLVAITHISNALGTINPIEEIIKYCRKRNVAILIDGTQAAPKLSLDMQNLDCDFYVFSSHKMYGPTGVGVLYAKYQHLSIMSPYQGGGEMVLDFSDDGITYNSIPYKFEAGTQNIAGIIAFGAAIDYINSIGISNITSYEAELKEHLSTSLSNINGLRCIGNADNRSGIFSFVLDNIHPHDIGTILNEDGIAVRSGHHCASLLMKRYKVPATTRISVCFYNTKEEIDFACNAIDKVYKLFNG